MKSKLIFTLPAIIVALLIFVASLFVETLPFINENIIGWDKLTHILVFFILSIFLQIAFAANKSHWSNKKIGIVSALTALICALSDEIHQYFVPGRLCDIWDFAADAIGVSLSLFFINIACKFAKSKVKKLEK